MKYVLALLADWANGIFAVLIASAITGTEVLWWHYVIGIALSHGPDIDAIPELWRRGKVAASAENPHDHRDGLHYPLLLVPVLFVFPMWFGYFGWVLWCAVVLHFVNDMYGTGWGLKLGWPFSSRSYKFLCRRVNRSKGQLQSEGLWQTLPESERKLRILVSWSATELPDYQRRWGMEQWIDVCYLRFNWISAVEYSLFIAAVVLATLSLLQ
jgi:hypothetical protein